MKNWNLMQNAADFGGYFIDVKIAHCCYIYMYFHYVRKFHKMWNIGMKYVTYWYQFFTRCEELVPIFHSEKFAKFEICGLTGLVSFTGAWHKN